MSVAIFLLSFPPISSAVIHSLQYFYTASSGISGLPEFISVGQVNGIDISYYDSSSRKGVPKQDWMKFDQTYWLKETEVAREYERAFKKDMGILKDRFNQTRGVHVFQKTYGCQWDDETDATPGFEQFGYDGEDFMSLDLNNLRWTAVVPQALATKDKWNRMENAFGYRKNYFQKDCVEWLKEYVRYGSSTLGSKVPPEVSLFQKGSTGPVVCHATGFYPEGVMITWKRDGEEMQDDVDVGEMLPNEDGTFQKRSVLTVSPEERKKHQYSCQVTHKSGEPTVLMFHEEGNSLPVVVSVIVTAAALLVGVIVAVVIKKKKGYTKASQSDTSSDTSNGAPKA